MKENVPKTKTVEAKTHPAVQLLTTLVETPSVSRTPGEKKIGKIIHDRLLSEGKGLLDVFFIGNNVIAKIGSSEKNASAIAFVPHLDTMPAKDWDMQPFEAKQDGDKIYGLGSSDAKGSVVATFYALLEAAQDKELVSKLKDNKQAIYAAFTIGEEISSPEGMDFVRERLKSDYNISTLAAIIGEARGYRVDFSENGREVLGITFKSEQGPQHPARRKGVNPIIGLAQELDAMNKWKEDVAKKVPTNEIPIFEPTVIIGGDEKVRNQIPGNAIAHVDIRTTPTYDGKRVLNELLEQRIDKKNTTIEVVSRNVLEARSTPEDSPLRRYVVEAFEKNGIKPEIGHTTSVTEWAFMDPGVVGAIAGPGYPENAHRANEFTSKEMVEKYVSIYSEIMKSAPDLLKKLSESNTMESSTKVLSPDSSSPNGVKKLWQKSDKRLDSFVEYFETKDDILLDNKLIPYDIQGSLAHAKMLCKIGILTNEELGKIEKGLGEINNLYEKGEFNLQPGDEDIHTKIENFLTEKYGDVGKKIHTGRSRNDQVLTAIRLYTKAEFEKIQEETAKFIDVFKEFNKKFGSIQMPGYTHMQKAMPSSVGLWTESFISSLEGDMNMMKAAYDLIDQSPLGSAAGYGVPLNLDKKLTADLMNFNRVQENPIYVQQSRGKFEAAVLDSLVQVLLTVNKFASDVMLFTTQEFNFFQASDSITTGSSIMPQKKNVDLAELLRSKVHLVLGNYTKLVSLNSNLISGYNRDLQDSKKPLMESLDETLDSLKAATILVNNLVPNEKVLKDSMTEDLYATHKAFKLVEQGIPFREAYLKVGKELQNTQ